MGTEGYVDQVFDPVGTLSWPLANIRNGVSWLTQVTCFYF